MKNAKATGSGKPRRNKHKKSSLLLHLVFFWLIMMVSWISAFPQQIANGVYWVYFTDKSGNGFDVHSPEAFLSQRSINRRAVQGLAVDRRDLPVTKSYLDDLKLMGVEIRHVSRWLNGVAMINMDSALFQQVLAKPFTTLDPWLPDPNDTFYPASSPEPRFSSASTTPPGFDYGVATEQVTMIKVDKLHNLGYTGRGVWIGVLDAGFLHADSLPAFQKMIQEGRLLGTRNYVNETDVFEERSAHGMYVLSTMASEWNGYIVGTAPHASYFLCVTEDVSRETRIEELAWVEAAEFVDSLGIDVINTSLGYSNLDGTDFDYLPAEMDGKTTFISRAASLAASRGMIECNSAGNSGDNSWYIVTAPADATDILTVGAVDSVGLIGTFSSHGPTADNRTKPDVVAMGVATGFQSIYGGLGRGSGTSFSSPVLAGAVACLWQAYPIVPAASIIQKVIRSADRYNEPGTFYGYGLPSFDLAWGSFFQGDETHIDLFPNPASDRIMILLPGGLSGEFQLTFHDLGGRIIYQRMVSLPGNVSLPSSLSQGVYILEVRSEDGIYRHMMIKK